MIGEQEAVSGNEYDFNIEGLLLGRCRITKIDERDEENGNHIYSADLVSITSGDKTYWDGGVLQSEIIINPVADVL